MLIWSSAYHPWVCPVYEKGDYQKTQSIHAAAYSARDPSIRDACVPESDCYEGDSLSLGQRKRVSGNVTPVWHTRMMLASLIKPCWRLSTAVIWSLMCLMGYPDSLSSPQV